MSKFYETDKFKKLNAAWYKKLKGIGFKDAEQQTVLKKAYGSPLATEDRLKTWSSSFFRGRYNQTQYEARETYYRLAGQFLNEHSFENELEHKIWKLHSDGLSFKSIGLKLGCSIEKARKVIKSLYKLMMAEKKKVIADDSD